jgi:hypothetical protein
MKECASCIEGKAGACGRSSNEGKNKEDEVIPVISQNLTALRSWEEVKCQDDELTFGTS